MTKQTKQSLRYIALMALAAMCAGLGVKWAAERQEEWVRVLAQEV